MIDGVRLRNKKKQLVPRLIVFSTSLFPCQWWLVKVTFRVNGTTFQGTIPIQPMLAHPLDLLNLISRSLASQKITGDVRCPATLWVQPKWPLKPQYHQKTKPNVSSNNYWPMRHCDPFNTGLDLQGPMGCVDWIINHQLTVFHSQNKSAPATGQSNKLLLSQVPSAAEMKVTNNLASLPSSGRCVTSGVLSSAPTS